LTFPSLGEGFVTLVRGRETPLTFPSLGDGFVTLVSGRCTRDRFPWLGDGFRHGVPNLSPLPARRSNAPRCSAFSVRARLVAAKK
jgi:hypothetical protein